MPQIQQVENKNKIISLVKKNYVAILCFIILEIIVLLHSSGIWEETNHNTTSSYSLDKNYQENILSSDDGGKLFNIDIHDIQLTAIDFYAEIMEGTGEIGWVLKKVNGECISSGQLYADNYSDGKYRIEIDESTIQDSDSYQLELTMAEGNAIKIYTDFSNYVRAVYYYNFHYGQIIHRIIIVVNIVIAIILALLLSRIGIYKKYWLIAVSTGVLSIALVIPLSTADEFRHFARAYSLAEGNALCTYDGQGNPYTEIPANIYNLRYMAPANVDQVADETNFTINISRWIYYLQREDNDDRVGAWMGGVHEKGILEYLPQVIAIRIGMFLGVRQIGLFYCARIGNWIAVAVIWFLILRLAPKYKFLFMVLYCMPTNIVYACTSSTDGILNAMVALVMAMAIKCYYDNITLTNKKVIFTLFVISTYIAIIKMPYILVAYLFAALASDLTYSGRNWKNIVRNIIIVTVICFFSYLCADVYKGFYSHGSSESNYNGYVQYILHHVLEASRVLFLQEFMCNFDGYYRQALAINSFGITVLVLPYTVLMVCGGACEKSERKIQMMQLMIMLLICIGMWASVLLAAYTWSGIGATQLWGVQGRYMCPIIMIGSMILALSDKVSSEGSKRFIPAFCMFLLTAAFLNIVQMQWI